MRAEHGGEDEAKRGLKSVGSGEGDSLGNGVRHRAPVEAKKGGR